MKTSFQVRLCLRQVPAQSPVGGARCPDGARNLRGRHAHGPAGQLAEAAPAALHCAKGRQRLLGGGGQRCGSEGKGDRGLDCQVLC